MRRIVLYISFVLLLFSCSGRDVVEADSSSIASLWRYARGGTVLLAEDITLSGWVVANSKYGELRKAIVVADHSGGVMIELDMDDTHTLYPMYSRVEISCSGLWLGVVGPKLILGAEPSDEFVVDRISATEAQNRIALLTYNNDTPTCRHRRVAELEYHDVLSYVAIEGIRIIEAERGCCWADIDSLSKEPQTTLRYFAQGEDTLRVLTDAHCLYATEAIPTAEVDVRGILDWYDGDIALRISDRYIEARYW